MAVDDITLLVRQDVTLCSYGEHFINNAGYLNQSKHYISQKLRELGRLLKAVKQICPDVKSSKDLIDPKRFDDVIRGVKIVCGYNETTQEFSMPSLARKLGQDLQKLSEVITAEAIKDSNVEEEKKAHDFQKLYNLT